MVPDNLHTDDNTKLEAELADLAALAANAELRDIFAEKKGLLSQIVEIVHLESGLREESRFQGLRVLGNVCVDNDINRELLCTETGFIRSLQNLVADNSVRIRRTSCIVMFNFANDNDLVQRNLIENNYTEIICNNLDLLSRDSTALEYSLKVLDLLLQNEAASENSILSTEALSHLEMVWDEPKNIAFIDLLVAVLEHEKFQIIYAESKEKIAKLCVYCERLDREEENPEVAKSILHKLVLGCSTVSGLDQFLKVVSIDDDLCDLWISWIKNSKASSELKIVGATFLGNICRTDFNCTKAVHDKNLHRLVIADIANTEMAAQLYSDAGLLKNLAISAANKRKMVSDGVLLIIQKLLNTGASPYISFTGLGILRQLMVSEWQNCVDLVNDRISLLQNVLLLFDTSNEKSIKIESSRIMFAIVRSLSFKASNVTDPLTYLAEKLQNAEVGESLLKSIQYVLLDSNSTQLLLGESILTLALILKLKPTSNLLAFYNLVNNDVAIQGKLTEVRNDQNIPQAIKDNTQLISTMLFKLDAITSSK
ncbi:hypothetical protein V1511DRAFT_504912 [Dipodascopsis uninucleata]